MDISKLRLVKEKKLDISKFFEGEENYITIKFIDRKEWRYISKLSLKTDDVLIYNQFSKNKPFHKKDKLTAVDLLKEKKENQENFIQAALDIPDAEIKNACKMTEKLNDLLIEFGIDENNHSFTDNNKPVKLTKELIKDFQFIFSKEKNLLEFILSEILNYNRGYELGE